mmetsp:Transcript_68381/g.154842  ORF Transcript_68381/g.154842 Transcript_68381/m.154842 type:complete len:215 (-) Transcript_68381:1010-1654(-)
MDSWVLLPLLGMAGRWPLANVSRTCCAQRRVLSSRIFLMLSVISCAQGGRSSSPASGFALEPSCLPVADHSPGGTCREKELTSSWLRFSMSSLLDSCSETLSTLSGARSPAPIVRPVSWFRRTLMRFCVSSCELNVSLSRQCMVSICLSMRFRSTSPFERTRSTMRSKNSLRDTWPWPSKSSMPKTSRGVVTPSALHSLAWSFSSMHTISARDR